MFRPLFRTSSEVTTFTNFFLSYAKHVIYNAYQCLTFVNNRMSIKGLVVTNKLYYIITKHDVD
jgi:hypothetical protein